MASCSDWWHAPVYITISGVLAFLAISTALHSTSDDATAPARPIKHPLSLNASTALRRSGFHIVATLLLISPENFFSSPNSTIFAVQDPALTSFPLWHLKHLLQYHSSPVKLSMDDLLKKPPSSCLPTLISGKNVAVTKADAKERLVEINHVPVSHPDIFLAEHIAIHGVLAPFSSPESQNLYQGLDSIQDPICDAGSSLDAEASDSKKMDEWVRIIHLLSFHGFVPFAIGLNSALHGILEDQRSLDYVTIFTPKYFTSIAAPSPILDKIVRLHILPQRVTYTELVSLPDKQVLGTLLPHQNLEITSRLHVTKRLTINGAEIVAPDIFSSNKFAVHGISQPFEIVALPGH